MPDQHLDGDRLSKLFTQRTVWLIPNIKIGSTESSSLCLEDDIADIGTYKEHSCSDVIESSPLYLEDDASAIDTCRIKKQSCELNSNPEKDTSGHEEHTSADSQSQLQQMFPDKTPEKIQQALVGKDITGAINSLLDDDSDLESEDWMMPLAATKIRKLDPLDALQAFITNVTQPHALEEDLVITREKSVIMQILKKYKNPAFDLRSPLNVQFVSSGTSELGVDAGGPTRDFFYILMKELVGGSFNGINLFEGETGHLTPMFNYDLLSSHFFVFVGKMVIHSVLHKCQGLEGISPAVVNYIISGSRDSVLEYLTVKDIPDPCLRDNLSELVSCSDSNLGQFMKHGDPQNIGDLLLAAGFPHLEITPGNRLLAYECCLTYEVITKRIPILDDLRKGLMSEQVMATSLLDLARIHPQVKQQLFPEADGRIHIDVLRKLVKYDVIDDDAKVKSKDHLEKYFCDLNIRGSDEETLKDLVKFWTGWPSLSIQEEELKVEFLPNDPNHVLALADTCFKVIKIPTGHKEYKEFMKYMDISVSYGKVGFGKV